MGAREGRAAALRRATLRYWRALRRQHVPRLAAMSAALLVGGALLIAALEAGAHGANIASVGEALWYGIVTMTGTGYGDFTATTTAGRVVAVLLMLGGMSLLSVLTATLASILVTQRIREGRGLETLKLRDHLLLCGWNQYGERVLEGLFARPSEGAVVLVNELSEEAASEILLRYPGRPLHYVRGDPAVEAVLERASVREARRAIVLADTAHLGGSGASDGRTTLVTLALKSLRPQLTVTAEVIDLTSETHLRRAGADDLVISGEFNGFLLSSAAVAPGISQVVRPLLSLSGNELRREAIPSELVGKTFREVAARLREQSGFLALAIVSEDRGLTLDDLLTDDSSLVDRFIKNEFSEAGREYLRFEPGGRSALVNPPDDYLVGASDAAIGIPGRR